MAGLVRILVSAGVLYGCLPGAGSAAPEPCPGERERAEAASRRVEEQWPLRRSDAVTTYVELVGRRVARAANAQATIPWRFGVLRNRNASAFSVGDGRVYVTDGSLLLMKSEAEFASLLAHEMGHQLAGHFCLRDRPWLSLGGRGGGGRQGGEGGLAQASDPQKELEADRETLRLLEGAGYPSRAALTAALRVSLQSAQTSGHMVSAERIRALEGLVQGRPAGPPQDDFQFQAVKQALAAELELPDATR